MILVGLSCPSPYVRLGLEIDATDVILGYESALSHLVLPYREKVGDHDPK